MKYSPAISVIIPTLNEEKLISQTLAQFTSEIKNQYRIQLIISDGGSKDKTLERLSPLVDILTSVQPGVKQNIPEGRNAGALKATGELLYFFNADTLIRNINEFFDITSKSFINPKILASTCRIRVFPDEALLKDKLFHNFYNFYVRSLNFLGMGMGRGECHIIRKDIFNRLKGYNESLSAGEDYDLFRRIRRIGKIKFCGKLTVYESPRRYRKFGYKKVVGDWIRNSLSVYFKNKSSSEEWEAVR